MALTFTQADLEKLKELLLTGADEVTIGDRRIRIRSQAQLLALIKMAQEYIDGTSTSDESASLVQATYKKGRAEE